MVFKIFELQQWSQAWKFQILKLQQWSEAGGGGRGGPTKLYTHLLRFVKNPDNLPARFPAQTTGFFFQKEQGAALSQKLIFELGYRDYDR